MLPKSGWSSHFALSPLPDQVTDGQRAGNVFGLCVHTSGRSVNKKAKKLKKHVDQVALEYYSTAKHSTHYVIGIEGSWQLTNDFERIQHVGFTDARRGMTAAELRQWYLSGAWAKELPATFVGRWQKAWSGYKSPSHLYPSAYPNDDYVAVELIPCEGFAEPARPGHLFTAGQHVQAALLAVDLAVRHGWPSGWASTPRVCTHESLAPHNRIERGQGWDPGVLRTKPYFDWELFKSQVRVFETMFALRQ